MGRGPSLVLFVLGLAIVAQVMRRRSTRRKDRIRQVTDRFSEPIESLLDEGESVLEEIRRRISR